MLKKNKDQLLTSKYKLLMSSYFSEEDSPYQNDSKIKEEDDLKFSQTKMDEIAEVENEDQDNNFFDDFINQNIQKKNKLKGESAKNSGKNVIERYSSEAKAKILLETPSNEDDANDYQHGSPNFMNEIWKEFDNESNMLQRLMNTKESKNERQSSHTDDEYRLSMPLQHDDSKKQLKTQVRKSENFDSYRTNQVLKTN